jgi:pyrroline-5-carboxylate reductase
MKKIAVIGTGNMGKAIINGLKNKYKIIASDIDKEKLNKIHAITVCDNCSAIGKSDIVLLAIKPQNMDSVLREIRNTVSQKQLVVSIAAGVNTKKIEMKLGNVPVVRVMPNTPSLVGMGMSVLCGGRYANKKHVKEAERIFSSIGKTMIIKNEQLMNAVTATSGSGPAYIYLFIESLIRAGTRLGLKKEIAEKLVLQTVKGSIELLLQSKKTPEELRKQVTSPGGTTEAALKVFEKRVFHDIVHLAVLSAHDRSKELSK